VYLQIMLHRALQTRALFFVYFLNYLIFLVIHSSKNRFFEKNNAKNVCN